MLMQNVCISQCLMFTCRLENSCYFANGLGIISQLAVRGATLHALWINSDSQSQSRKQHLSLKSKDAPPSGLVWYTSQLSVLPPPGTPTPHTPPSPASLLTWMRSRSEWLVVSKRRCRSSISRTRCCSFCSLRM